MAKGKGKPPKENPQDLTPEQLQAKIVANIDEKYRLDNLDRAIITTMMRYPSLSVKEIAESMGYTRTWISQRVNRPAFKAAMTEVRKGVMELLIDAQSEAIRRLKKELANEDPNIAISAAKALLAPLVRAEQNNTNIHQNLVYAVRFGEGGQLIRDVRTMKAEEFYHETESA